MRTIVLACLSLVPVVAVAQAPGRDPNLPGEIRTGGRATRIAKPDLVTVSISVSARALTPGAAGRANAHRANLIRAAVAGLGVPADSIVTTNYRSELVTNSYNRDTAFVATNTVVVRARKLELVGAIIDTALALGATRVEGVRYGVTAAEPLQREALADAARRARENAEIIAKAAGGSLGRLLELTTEPRYRGSYVGLEGVVVTGAGSSEATTISAGPMQVSAAVEGRWEFVPTAH